MYCNTDTARSNERDWTQMGNCSSELLLLKGMFHYPITIYVAGELHVTHPFTLNVSIP